MAIAASLHGSLGLLIGVGVRPSLAERTPARRVIEIEMPPPYENPSTSAPEPGPKPKRERARERAIPAPRAIAGKVLTRGPEPGAPLDMTDLVVVGAADRYAGGETSASGTRSDPVLERGPNDDEPGPRRDEPDRSRPAGTLGSLDWQCPFPEEAELERIDHAVSTIRVDVDLEGTIRDVTVLVDPGAGFGLKAVECARQRRWESARDRRGSPIPGSVVLHVRFDR